MKPEPEPLSPARDLELKRLNGLRILVADDNRDGADSMSELLSMKGAVVATRYDGAGAVTAVAEWRPDVAILDVAMPGVDGCEVAARVRAGEGAAPFLIALTGRLDDSTRERVARCGFNFHFAKPLDLGDLLHTLSAIEQIRAARRAPCGTE